MSSGDKDDGEAREACLGAWCHEICYGLRFVDLLMKTKAITVGTTYEVLGSRLLFQLARTRRIC